MNFAGFNVLSENDVYISIKPVDAFYIEIRLLHYPVSYVCYREGSVITNVLATRLFSVTVKIFLFISPRRLSCSPQHQDTEDKQDGQPHLCRKNKTHIKTYSTPRRNNMKQLEKLCGKFCIKKRDYHFIVSSFSDKFE